MTTDLRWYTTPATQPDDTHDDDLPTDYPLDHALPMFSWVAPSDTQVQAMLADPLSDGPDVIADDCGHVAPYGLVIAAVCGLFLCYGCAAAHDGTGCRECDADARACADPDE